MKHRPQLCPQSAAQLQPQSVRLSHLLVGSPFVSGTSPRAAR
ncbi:hypothetical protein GT031_08625 [Streptomyces sp. SID2888]|nr:hypothetical protein [Streptomyces sp. SID2888]